MRFFLTHQDVRKTEQRRKAVRRWWRRLERIACTVLWWCLAVGCLFGGYLAVTILPLFTAEEVAVQGDLHVLDADAVRALAGVPRGENLFRLSAAAIQRRLAAEPWIGEAAVGRKLPHTVWIYVGERVPSALLNLHGLYLVDETGAIFKPWAPGDPADLPVLSGVTEVRVDGEGIGRSAQVATLLRLKEAFERTPLGERLGCSELIMDRYRRLSIVTTQPALYVRFGAAPDARQMDRLQQVLPAVTAGGKMATVDVSIERKVVVRYGS